MKRFQQTMRNYFARIKLTTKLTALMAVFLIVPAIIISEISFYNMRRQLINSTTQQTAAILQKSILDTSAVIADCEIAADLIVEHYTDWRSQEADPASPDAVFDNLSIVAAANPKIFAIHLYLLNSDEAAPPFLYGVSDMEKQAWFTRPFPSNGVWKFNYLDVLAPVSKHADQSLALYFREMKDAAGRLLGILEVSVPMNALFPDIYHLSQTQMASFVDEKGNVYYDKFGSSSSWWNTIGSVVHTAAAGSHAFYSTLLSASGHDIVVLAMPLPEFSGHMIWAVRMDEPFLQIASARAIFYLVLLAVVVGSVFLMNRILGRIFRRFYSLTTIAQEVQGGNFDVTVPDMGYDEIGLLAGNIRDTIERIQQLLEANVERELLVKTTEVRALQTQINSHFIYNVLESIKMMAEIEEEFAISDAVTSLGSLLRYSMKWPSTVVTLQEELEYIQNYINLINLRYDYTITLKKAVPDALLKEQIPKMSLQPIVENAIYHGIEGLREDAVININVNEVDRYFEVEIIDSGKGMDAQALERLRLQVYNPSKEDINRKGGIGLRNVHNRIRLSFGDAYGLRFEAKENHYMRVTVKLPKTAQEDMHEQTADC